MIVKEFFKLLDSLLKPCLQENFDNTGSQIAASQSNVTGILLSMDVNEKILVEAVDKNCSVVITHHPLFFKSIKMIDTSDPSSALIQFALNNQISIYSAHTNLDKRYYDTLAKKIGFDDSIVLIPTNLEEDETMGFGSLVKDINLSLEDLLSLLKSKLDLSGLRFNGRLDKKISSIALINGSGSSFIESLLLDESIDCLVTGDVGYHTFQRASLFDFPVIDAGHYATEKHLLDFLYDEVHNYLTNHSILKDISMYKTIVEDDPIKFF
jgi:dinuclear metal center YbgI/SA1388 family protein